MRRGTAGCVGVRQRAAGWDAVRRRSDVSLLLLPLFFPHLVPLPPNPPTLP